MSRQTRSSYGRIRQAGRHPRLRGGRGGGGVAGHRTTASCWPSRRGTVCGQRRRGATTSALINATSSGRAPQRCSPAAAMGSAASPLRRRGRALGGATSGEGPGARRVATKPPGQRHLGVRGLARGWRAAGVPDGGGRRGSVVNHMGATTDHVVLVRAVPDSGTVLLRDPASDQAGDPVTSLVAGRLARFSPLPGTVWRCAVIGRVNPWRFALRSTRAIPAPTPRGGRTSNRPASTAPVESSGSRPWPADPGLGLAHRGRGTWILGITPP